MSIFNDSVDRYKFIKFHARLNRIQLFVNALVMLVDVEIGLVQFIVNPTVVWIGFKGFADLDVFMDIVECHIAQGHRCNKGRPPCIGLDGVFHLPDGSI